MHDNSQNSLLHFFQKVRDLLTLTHLLYQALACLTYLALTSVAYITNLAFTSATCIIYMTLTLPYLSLSTLINTLPSAYLPLSTLLNTSPAAHIPYSPATISIILTWRSLTVLTGADVDNRVATSFYVDDLYINLV